MTFPLEILLPPANYYNLGTPVAVKFSAEHVSLSKEEEEEEEKKHTHAAGSFSVQVRRATRFKVTFFEAASTSKTPADSYREH